MTMADAGDNTSAGMPVHFSSPIEGESPTAAQIAAGDFSTPIAGDFSGIPNEFVNANGEFVGEMPQQGTAEWEWLTMSL